MAFIARALSLAGLLITVGAQEASDYKEVAPNPNGGVNPRCHEVDPAGTWKDVTEAQCKNFVSIQGGQFASTPASNAPWGCSRGDFGTNTYQYVQPGNTNFNEESSEYRIVCIKASYTVTCQGMTCLERFRHYCEENKAGFGSNNNAAASANSPKDILVAECPDCDGAASTDICPTKLRLYDAAEEAEPTPRLDRTSVAVSVPLGLVSALVVVGALVRVSRSRASNGPAPVEDEQDLLRK
ncbi:unnamed protein product [Prorocentrum cordatum]|uniref:Uncharacterized protein n=1 Tax=Prorocentrum cordatum TaxID=2364126 RepID=A0ABN9PFC3_9DINO|nr:unnamed protein product [Polarella glacialis]